VNSLRFFKEESHILINKEAARRIKYEIPETLLGIANNAGSIPEKILENIFDPYFTTKQQSKGTGLGLYMAKTIIEQNMGGKISIKNLDDGVSFIIEI